ncbi:hypothetical protein MAPG_03496 [Magnaporthiopsis poae ATCC 64411]|uniref:Ankyrin repeat protein n=1 Tax=Magnaporthiopsis poae (strain ATCC 64411 / 73-15) TaxID=644358 RepID=A0A0C4DU61_MAGP6|nr:hypothetical protein MAPG_03496 [Magnaporthiopsis poae ATCC 64411]
MREFGCYHMRLLGKDAVKAIKYFIDKGAHVNATWKGRSCTAIAYRMDEDTSSYIGDVWDAALAATGHDVEEFRRREQRPHSPRFWTSLHPHIGWGIRSYTLTDFKDIWEGMEDRCPYYDDVTSAGEGRLTIVGVDCKRSWCSGRPRRVEEVGGSSSEWETESEGCDSDSPAE